jgi:hypothetical protein
MQVAHLFAPGTRILEYRTKTIYVPHVKERREETRIQSLGKQSGRCDVIFVDMIIEKGFVVE